jgi:hypothetical protein
MQGYLLSVLLMGIHKMVGQHSLISSHSTVLHRQTSKQFLRKPLPPNLCIGMHVDWRIDSNSGTVESLSNNLCIWKSLCLPTLAACSNSLLQTAPIEGEVRGSLPITSLSPQTAQDLIYIQYICHLSVGKIRSNAQGLPMWR